MSPFMLAPQWLSLSAMPYVSLHAEEALTKKPLGYKGGETGDLKETDDKLKGTWDMNNLVW